MSEFIEISKLIRNLDLFNFLDNSNIESVAELFKIEEFSMGEPIKKGGFTTQSIRILFEGEIRQLVEHPATKSTVTLSVEKANHIIGWSTFQQGLSIELVTAASDCRLLKISITDWKKLLKRFPELSKNLNQIINPLDI